ncbi:acyl-CoA synthetase [Rhodococcus sp. 06-418-5]|uniref:AMP-binding protein n=1 Tax=Rhodococcus sp. 06-418-5 TaxID=2022507 RepID=UPI000B9C6A7B|nr:AMP-binding protein [Rhodococcus sp. 06-418-5]OZC81292.1 acyl-CoA synthetase [Rhodococcus sp. 06-418-5]
MSGLDTPLTPLRFLARASAVHPTKVAVIDGSRRWTYAALARDVQRLAKALRKSGIRPGDRVAYLASNSAEMLCAHFAVPLAGGVLVAINTRLAAGEIEYICDHAEASILVADALLLHGNDLSSTTSTVREVVETPGYEGQYEHIPGTITYDALLDRGADQDDIEWQVDDENAVIAINYTSGTTGRPKGVMYTHRGAYLNALGELHHQRFGVDTRYLWTLPMFHCNGWCSTWAVTAASGTHVCLRAVRGDAIWELIDSERIDHLAGAPTVLSLLVAARQAHHLDSPLTVVTAGAPPSPTTIGAVRDLGATLVHVYGLTETYGPYSVCEDKPEWAELPAEEQSRLMARQGVGLLTADDLRVVRKGLNADGRLTDVVPDGVEMGEIVMSGNNVMKGYYRDAPGTESAFEGGWFHSGDLGVMHPDGYVQLLDRAKDVVISGGENISSIEVEQALMSHPAVADVAVVGVPDEKWGETPKAFVVLAPGSRSSATELISHVRTAIASYKAPQTIEFMDELPKTSTGKTRKNELRGASSDIEVPLH